MNEEIHDPAEKSPLQEEAASSFEGDQITSPPQAPSLDEKEEKYWHFNSHLNGSENEQVNFFQGKNEIKNILVEHFSFGVGQAPAKIPLIEKSKPFGTRNDADLEFDENMTAYLEQLAIHRIILLGDQTYGNSPAIAYKLAASLEIANKKENLRHFSIASEKIKEIDIHSFSFERENKADRVVVIIDATKNEDLFTASLLLDCETTLDQQLPIELQVNNLFLICLIPSKYLEDWLKKKDENQKGFPYWILPGRKSEKQSRQDAEKFENLLESSSFEEEKIIQTVFFTGAFFPNLLVSDFVSLIESWLFYLDEESNMIHKHSIPQKENEEKEVSKPPPLLLLWRSKPDFYLRKCLLHQHKTDDGKNFINFAESNSPELVQAILGKHTPIALQKQISAISELGLVFHTSEDIANRSISLFAEYFLDSQEVNVNWLLRTFIFLNGVEEITETLDVLDTLGVIPQQHIRNKERELIEKNFYYHRLAKVFREMFRHEILAGIVESIFDRLIQERSYKVVLLLVKRLLYTPNFDGFYWMKQLAERGDGNLRANIEKYLLSSLVSGRIEIEQLMNWLPETELPFEKKSQANAMALKILLKYLVLITQNFDEKLYHLEPSKFPLFIYGERKQAEERLNIIIKYLAHPWKDKVWRDIWEEIKRLSDVPLTTISSLRVPYNSLLAQIIETWGFILDTPLVAGSSKFKKPPRERNNSLQVDNKTVFDMLLEKVVFYVDRSQQKEIILFWKDMKQSLGLYITDDKWRLAVNEREEVKRRKVFISKLEETFTRKSFQTTQKNILKGR